MIFGYFFNPQSGLTHSDSQNVSAESDNNTEEDNNYHSDDGKESCALSILFIKMYLQTLLHRTSRYTLRKE